MLKKDITFFHLANYSIYRPVVNVNSMLGVPCELGSIHAEVNSVSKQMVQQCVSSSSHSKALNRINRIRNIMCIHH